MARLSVTGAQIEQPQVFFLLKYECVLETEGSVCLHFEAVMHQGVD